MKKRIVSILLSLSLALGFSLVNTSAVQADMASDSKLWTTVERKLPAMAKVIATDLRQGQDAAYRPSGDDVEAKINTYITTTVSDYADVKTAYESFTTPYYKNTIFKIKLQDAIFKEFDPIVNNKLNPIVDEEQGKSSWDYNPLSYLSTKTKAWLGILVQGGLLGAIQYKWNVVGSVVTTAKNFGVEKYNSARTGLGNKVCDGSLGKWTQNHYCPVSGPKEIYRNCIVDKKTNDRVCKTQEEMCPAKLAKDKQKEELIAKRKEKNGLCFENEDARIAEEKKLSDYCDELNKRLNDLAIEKEELEKQSSDCKCEEKKELRPFGCTCDGEYGINDSLKLVQDDIEKNKGEGRRRTQKCQL